MPLSVTIVVLAAIAGTLLIVYWGIRHEEKKMTLRRGNPESIAKLEATIGGMAGEMNRLRERVQVLEKLVTDDDRKLADEIERLKRGESRV